MLVQNLVPRTSPQAFRLTCWALGWSARKLPTQSALPADTATTTSDQCKANFVPAPLLNLFRLQQDLLQLESLLILEEQNQIAYPGKPVAVWAQQRKVVRFLDRRWQEQTWWLSNNSHITCPTCRCTSRLAAWLSAWYVCIQKLTSRKAQDRQVLVGRQA